MRILGNKNSVKVNIRGRNSKGKAVLKVTLERILGNCKQSPSAYTTQNVTQGQEL